MGLRDAVDSLPVAYPQPQDRRTSGSSNWPCFLEKTEQAGCPFLAEMFTSRDEFQLCWGQLRPAEELNADAQTLLTNK